MHWERQLYRVSELARRLGTYWLLWSREQTTVKWPPGRGRPPDVNGPRQVASRSGRHVTAVKRHRGRNVTSASHLTWSVQPTVTRTCSAGGAPRERRAPSHASECQPAKHKAPALSEGRISATKACPPEDRRLRRRARRPTRHPVIEAHSAVGSMTCRAGGGKASSGPRKDAD